MNAATLAAAGIPTAVVVTVMLYLHRDIKKDLRTGLAGLEERLVKQMDALGDRLTKQMDALEQRIEKRLDALEERIARVEERAVSLAATMWEQPQAVFGSNVRPPATAGAPMMFRERPTGKYAPLTAHLHGIRQEVCKLAFPDIEEIIGSPFPASARHSRYYRAWWGNHESHPQARAWMAAGWLVVDVDLETETVTFGREDLTA